MTDNELIKVQEAALRVAKETINRQKAEIERLKNECFCLANERDAYRDVLDTTVTEARKEFAERLNKVFWSFAECDILIRKAIDNLLEEMESERE